MIEAVIEAVSTAIERLGTEGRFADVEWRATQHRLASKNIAQNSSQTWLAKRLRMGEPPSSLRAGTSSHCFCTSLLSCEGTTRGRRQELLNIAAPSTLLPSTVRCAEAIPLLGVASLSVCGSSNAG